MNKKGQRSIKTGLLCAAYAAGGFAAGYYAGIGLLAALALFIPMLFIYLRGRTQVWVTILCVAVFAVLAGLMAGWRAGATTAACTLAVALPTGYAVRRKTTFYFSALTGCAAMLAGLGVLVLCAWLFWGQSLAGLYASVSEAWYYAHPDFARSVYAALEVSQNAQSVDLTAAYAAYLAVADVPLAEIMPTLTAGMELAAAQNVPWICAAVIPLFGLLDYLIPRARLKKKGYEVGALPPFTMWKLPNGFGWFSVALLLLAYLAPMFGWEGFAQGSQIIIMFLNVVYSVQGMALANWLLEKGVRRQGARTTIIIFIFILCLMFGFWIYMWAGLAEQLLKIRFREAADER